MAAVASAEQECSEGITAAESAAFDRERQRESGIGQPQDNGSASREQEQGCTAQPTTQPTTHRKKRCQSSAEATAEPTAREIASSSIGTESGTASWFGIAVQWRLLV